MRERRERALLSMCIASPAEGREFLGRLTPEHLSSPVVGRAREWLLSHLEDPLTGLPREDDELVSLVTNLKMQSEREPVARDAMELNFLQLEQVGWRGGSTPRSRRGETPRWSSIAAAQSSWSASRTGRPRAPAD